MNVETKSTLRYEGLIAYSLVAYYVYPKCLVRGGRLILGVVVSGGTAAEQHSYLLLLLLPILLLLLGLVLAGLVFFTELIIVRLSRDLD